MARNISLFFASLASPRALLVAGLIPAISLVPTTAVGAVSDPSFTETVITNTDVRTTGMAWAPDVSHRLFLIRKDGDVRIVENGALLPTPFATLSPVQRTSECGLIGIAFDPSFASNGFVYFFVSRSPTEQQVVRYRADGNVGIEETLIVGGLPTRGANHNGGGVGIGPDGKIYWAIGDNGNFTGVDGDLSSLAAKVGRANRDGSIPEDNPFFDGPGPNADLIWARGLRNPFSFTFQPTTGLLWVNIAGTGYEQSIVLSAGDHAGFDDYENNQPAGFVAPAVAYRTNLANVRSIELDGAARTAGVATFTTTANHRYRPGAKVTIAGVNDTSFDTTAYITSTPSPTVFTVAQPGPDATSGRGTVAPLNIGGAITGGTFLDSSSVPAEYRGNFFFGDYNSGNLVRATLDTSNAVTSVDIWGDIQRTIDMSVGPDGDLYYVSFNGVVFRARYNATAQGIVVSKLHVQTDEGGSTAFHVRLAVAPTSDTLVTLARSSGSADVSVARGSALTFTSANWSTPQPVLVDAAADPDSTDDEAVLTASSPSLASEDVTVRVVDDDPISIVVSPSALTLAEGTSATIDVSLSSRPSSALALTVARSAGDSDVSVTTGGSISFDAGNWDAPQAVTITAARDTDANDDTATLSATAPGLPTREIAVTVEEPRDASVGAAGSSGSAGAGAGDAGAVGGGTLGSGGGSADGDAGASTSVTGKDPGGCSCRAASSGHGAWALPIVFAAFWRRARRPVA